MNFKAIENRIILEILSGSHLYGTNTESSDHDYIGIFIPPRECIIGLKSVKEVNDSVISKNDNGKNTLNAIDKKYYEYRNFVNLALGNNPNIIELLFAPKNNIIQSNDYGDMLINNQLLFPSKLCINKFLGYAKSQKHKMYIKKDKLNDLRAAHTALMNYSGKTVIGELRNIFPIQKGKHICIGDINLEPGVYVSKARKILKDRIDKFTNRKELIDEYGFDTKYASHLIRLLKEGIELLDTGRIEFPLKYKQELLDIKNGKCSLEYVIELSNNLEKEFEQVSLRSILPQTPNYKKIEKLVIDTMINWV